MTCFNVRPLHNTNFFGCAVLWYAAEPVFLWLIQMRGIRASAKILSMLSTNCTVSHITLLAGVHARKTTKMALSNSANLN